MPSSQDSINQKLSFTRDNRHQYLETAMVSASESEREMMEAEARGREHRIRAVAMKKNIRRTGWALMVLAVLGLVGALLR